MLKILLVFYDNPVKILIDDGQPHYLSRKVYVLLKIKGGHEKFDGTREQTRASHSLKVVTQNLVEEDCNRLVDSLFLHSLAKVYDSFIGTS